VKKKIVIVLSSICILIIINFLTIAVSINNFYKGLYHKDPNIIKSSINFPEFKENLKNTFNAILIDQSSKNKAKDGMEIFAQGIALKLSEMLIDSYATPRGILILLDDIDLKSIGEPSFIKSIYALKNIHFVSINEIYFEFTRNKVTLPVYFTRSGLSWKLVDIKIPEKTIKEINKNINNQ
jgi:hypothetical protein